MLIATERKGGKGFPWEIIISGVVQVVLDHASVSLPLCVNHIASRAGTVSYSRKASI